MEEVEEEAKARVNTLDCKKNQSAFLKATKNYLKDRQTYCNVVPFIAGSVATLFNYVFHEIIITSIK